MKRYLSFSLLLLTSYLLPLTSLSSPYPVTINSRVQTAPPLTVYKSTEATFRVTFTEGATPSDVTGAQPFMVWGTNATASAYSTSSVSVVSSPTGIVDFIFSPASVNYAAGRYVYEVGIQTGNVIRVYRQGLFTIYDSLVGSLARSLYGSGTSVVWQTSINWNLVNWLNLPSYATEPYVTNRIAAALAPVAASVTNLSLTLSATTQTVASVASQVTNLSQSVEAVQSIFSTNQWIGIDSVPASASRIIVAPGILQTTDTNGVVDLWRITNNYEFFVNDAWIYGTPPPFTSATHPFSIYDGSQYTWSSSVVGDDVRLIVGAYGYWANTGKVSSLFYLFGDSTDAGGVPSVSSSVATNHIARLASTNDINTALAAWMNSDEAGEWIYGVAGNISVGVVDNHANNPAAHRTANDSRYLSSTPGWFWQGSQQIAYAPETTNVTGYTTQTSHGFELIPYTTTRHDVTGSVTFVCSRPIVGITYDFYKPETGITPTIPVNCLDFRTSPTSWTVKAWCATSPLNFFSYYLAYVSNLVVYTYDRSEMGIGSYTNDGAGIVTRIDTLPSAFGVPNVTNDPRRAVNAGSMAAYVESRKTDIADKAWRRTPGGRDSPSPYTVTLDQPLVMQGAISFVNSGNYCAMSAIGGDWYTSTTGCTWRVGVGGSAALEIASTNRLLNIIQFTVAEGYATIDISTNWVQSTPVIEFADNLDNSQWLQCPAQNMTEEGGFWRGVCPAVAEKRFFRAVDRQGNNRITSFYPHEFKGAITVFGQTFNSLSELKTALEALP